MENFNVLTPLKDIPEALNTPPEICVLAEINYEMVKELTANG